MGQLPSSTRHLNSHLSTLGTPSSNSAFSQSIFDFTKIVLGFDLIQPGFPSSPPVVQTTNYIHRSDEVLNNTSIFNKFRISVLQNQDSLQECAGKRKCIPVVVREWFAADIEKTQVTHISFAWDEKPDSSFNSWFSKMILKHWDFAKSQGFFTKYLFAPSHDTMANAAKVIFRWLVGRQNILKKTRVNSNWQMSASSNQKKSRIRRQLVEHCVDTCLHYSLPEEVTKIFETTLCTSDTEIDDEGNLTRVDVNWRSNELGDLAHRMDQLTIERLVAEKGRSRVRSMNLLELRRKGVVANLKDANIPLGLPCNCYKPEFMASQSAVAVEFLQVDNTLINFPRI
ncbi:hypothetical protein PPACK8108_LOCUS24194 [Phakopsora pachyrhizi]|uniref:Uncharacterized protein n=1 Tax=Phakopsora pachyrhizi TaxID=170000 RepID=A0AAV0BPA5_PHAPC|nr:hypothetical protein PPACK8108_LOCUS24194 [Phakopsora pachyrhizi]